MAEIRWRGRHFEVTEDYFEFLYGVYGEGLEGQLGNMDAWLDAHPARRKKNYKRFIVNWLNKETRILTLARQKEIEVEREIHVGAGPQAFECRKCRRRLVAAFLPATCPRCGSLQGFTTSP